MQALTSDFIIDLRTSEAFQASHFFNATHIEFDLLDGRINELPARPALLNLVSETEKQATDAAVLLESKGYLIEHAESFQNWQKISQNLPGLAFESGRKSRVLWQPSPLIKEFLALKEVQNALSNGMHGVDLGCGGGRDATFLALNGLKMTGVEHKVQVLNRAKQLAHYHQAKVNWLNCDVLNPDCFAQDKFDLVVVIRFLDRDLFDLIKQCLKPGGWLVFQTFSEGCEAFGSPKNPRFILKNHELSEVFSEYPIIVDRIDTLADGRPVNSFIARSPIC